MRITFVHPAGYNFTPGKPDITVLVNRMAPIGILQLAAFLESRGHTAFVHDCMGPLAPSTLEDNVEMILATKPELIAFSTTTSAFLDGYDMAVLIKRKRPDVKIIFGGPHVSAMGTPLLTFFPEIDFLGIGEGEGLMADIASGRSPETIGNLIFRKENTVCSNPRRPRIKRLDDLPFPAYEKLAGFPERYHLPLFSFIKRFGATMVTSRGCPHTCSFCDRTVFQHEYSCNSPEYIWEHMRHLRDNFGVHHINFYDDLFTAHRQRILALCELLSSKSLGVDFNCAVRVGHADAELLTSLKRAGCIQISVGVESGDAELLSRHKLGITLEAVRATIQRAHATGLRVKGLFIFGLPGETSDSVSATSDFIHSAAFDEINISKFSPFYGAPVWKECSSGQGGKLQEDWRLMNCLHFTYVPQAFGSIAEMEFLYNRCIQRFYHGSHYQKLFWGRLWAHRWSLWHVMTHLPGFIYANSQFVPKRTLSPHSNKWPRLHPAQPQLSVSN